MVMNTPITGGSTSNLRSLRGAAKQGMDEAQERLQSRNIFDFYKLFKEPILFL